MSFAVVFCSSTILTSFTYSFVLIVIALEMADIETPSCRTTSAKGNSIILYQLIRYLQ
jgi:hypothetical protein